MRVFTVFALKLMICQFSLFFRSVQNMEKRLQANAYIAVSICIGRIELYRKNRFSIERWNSGYNEFVTVGQR